MRYVELFAGVGGFRLGIQKANKKAKCVYANEFDKYAAQTYDKNFGGHIDQRDITTVPATDIPAHDLICAGFPCQAFSVAGKRRGFEETRGTLFFDICRIARHHRTPYLFLENVKGLLNHDGGATFHTILKSLDELGYDCQWEVLNSKDFGVPQNRERVFIIGHFRGRPRPEVFPLGSTDEAIDGHKSVPKVIARGGLQNHAGEMIEQSPALTEAMGKGGGQIARLNNPTHSSDRVYGADGVSPTINTMQGGGRQPFVNTPEATKKGYAEATVGDSINLSAPNSKTRRGRVGKGIAQTVDTEARQAVVSRTVRSGGNKSPHGSRHNWDSYQVGQSIRRLTPIECERLQGFPDNWASGVSDTQRYKQMGNALTVPVVEAITLQWLRNTK